MKIYISDIVSPQTLLLFEILDDPPSLSFRLSNSDRAEIVVKKYNKLAWAFLLPVGQSGSFIKQQYFYSNWFYHFKTYNSIVNVGYNQQPNRSSSPNTKTKQKSNIEAKGEGKGETKGEANGEEKDNLTIQVTSEYSGEYDLSLRLQLYQYQLSEWLFFIIILLFLNF